MMDDKQTGFDYTDLYGHSSAGRAAGQNAAGSGPDRAQARENAARQTETELQRELEEQLRGLGQSVTDGLRYGFEGRGEELGSRARRFGGAVRDIVYYSLDQAADGLQEAADELRGDGRSTQGRRTRREEHRAKRTDTQGQTVRYGGLWSGKGGLRELLFGRQLTELERQAKERFGVGLTQAITGGVFAFGLLLAGFICIVAAPYTTDPAALADAALAARDQSIVETVGACLFAGGLPFVWLAWLGGRNLGAARRIRAYADAIGEQKSIPVQALAEAVQKPLKKVRRDLRRLLGKGWMSGYLDAEGETLYLTAEEWRAARGFDDPARPQAAPPEAEQPAEEPAAPAPEGAQQPEIDPDTIERFIRVLGDEKQLMQDDLAVDELTRMQKTSRAICDWVKAHPESAPKARRFVTYYIPTTLKLLHTYNEIKDQKGENADTIRRDIGGILHTLNLAFENLYNNLLSDVALDVSSEIAALQGMLAQDGLSREETRPF